MSDSSLYDYGKQAGQWVQHRGNSMHGVTDPKGSEINDPVVEFDNPHDKLDEEGIEPLDEKVMEPVPVRIVDGLRQRDTAIVHTAQRFGIPGGILPGEFGRAPIQIAPRDRRRTRLILVNTDAVIGLVIYVGDAQVNSGNGLPVNGTRDPIVLHTTDEVYATTAEPTDTKYNLSVWAEYKIEV